MGSYGECVLVPASGFQMRHWLLPVLLVPGGITHPRYLAMPMTANEGAGYWLRMMRWWAAE
jgi:hypothetical protein